jgi:hypothetical protein
MLQNLLNKVSFYNTPNARGDAFTPFALVLKPSRSSDKISRINAANYSQIAKEFQAERPSSSLPSFTLFTYTLSPSSYNRSASISTSITTKHQGRPATSNHKKGLAILPINRGHAIHNSEAPKGPDFPRGLP